MDISGRIRRLGQEMTACNEHCEGIKCCQEDGIPPRGLVYEAGGNEFSGCAIIGMNPGNPQSGESEFLSRAYKEGKDQFTQYESFWRDSLHGKNQYYKLLADLIKKLEIKGPTLWTELVKCQSEKRGGVIEVNTIRRCAKMYLSLELSIIPKDWLLIAAARKPYEIVSFLFPDRAVIGVPHPTGSHGNFREMLRTTDLRQVVDEALRQNAARWLGGGIKAADS